MIDRLRSWWRARRRRALGIHLLREDNTDLARQMQAINDACDQLHEDVAGLYLLISELRLTAGLDPETIPTKADDLDMGDPHGL